MTGSTGSQDTTASEADGGWIASAVAGLEDDEALVREAALLALEAVAPRADEGIMSKVRFELRLVLHICQH